MISLPRPLWLQASPLRTRRRVLIALALMLLTAGSVAAATVFILARMPDPESCPRLGLGRWLVTTDLAQQPVDTQQKLLKRVLHELDDGVEISAVQSCLNESQCCVLWQNAEFLCQLWFQQIADVYRVAAADDRNRLLDQLIGRVEGWGVIDQIARLREGENATASGENKAVSSASKIALLNEFHQRAQPWIESAPSARQPDLREFLSALEGRLFFRQMKNLRLFG